MAKRFSKKDVKVGEENGGLKVVHRFIYKEQKWYVLLEMDGTLSVWGG